MSNTVATKSAVIVILVVAAVFGQHHHVKQNGKKNVRRNDNPSQGGNYGVSRHFAHFSGPVSGAEHQVIVSRAPGHSQVPLHGAHAHQQYNHAAPAGTSVDYVAKPDYKFGYGVEDAKTGNKQTHEETREGDVVRGQYTVVEPDGSLRIVQYTADATHGFQAVVKRSGHAPEVFGGAIQSKQQPIHHQSQHVSSQHYQAHRETDDDDDEKESDGEEESDDDDENNEYDY